MRLVHAVLLLHPTERRAEMASTLLDVSAGSRRRFARELTDLVRIGLRARAASDSVRRTLADGFCLAGVWVLTLDLCLLLDQRTGGTHDPLLASPSLALLGLVLALALAGFDRLAGAGALLWTALRVPAILEHGVSLAPEALPVACFAVLLLAPRRRPPDLRRLLWLGVPAALLVAPLPFVALAALPVLAMLLTDPRIAIAAAVPLTTLAVQAIGHDASFMPRLLLLATPAALAVAVTRTLRLRARW